MSVKQCERNIRLWQKKIKAEDEKPRPKRHKRLPNWRDNLAGWKAKLEARKAGSRRRNKTHYAKIKLAATPADVAAFARKQEQGKRKRPERYQPWFKERQARWRKELAEIQKLQKMLLWTVNSDRRAAREARKARGSTGGGGGGGSCKGRSREPRTHAGTPIPRASLLQQIKTRLLAARELAPGFEDNWWGRTPPEPVIIAEPVVGRMCMRLCPMCENCCSFFACFVFVVVCFVHTVMSAALFLPAC